MGETVKHTPGPWSVGGTRKQQVDPRIGPFFETMIHVGDERDRGNVLATACMGGPGATATDAESVEANARLIAAAPDLLAACKALPLDRFSGEPDAADFKDAAGAFMRAMNIARVAIAKAEGRIA